MKSEWESGEFKAYWNVRRNREAAEKIFKVFLTIIKIIYQHHIYNYILKLFKNYAKAILNIFLYSARARSI